MIALTIDGMKVQVEAGTTILEAASQLGVEIPTFCHDPRLKPHGSCRICVVEIKGGRNLPTACCTPVGEGMEVWTESDDVIEARREILDLMLANHPLDCLTCDKAGRCTLQDLCYKYDIKESSYGGAKKEYETDESNPFYYSDQEKCILCGKCVYVCSQLQGTDAIGFAERGFDTHIATPFDKGLEHSTCVSCGNCVSVCPVGALMPKSKEKFRYWETKSTRTTCAYCGVGCQMDLLVKDNKVVEVDPAMGPSNEGLLCVKGKFAFNFINHPDRLKKPLVKKDGKLVETSWEEAYQVIVDKVKHTKENFGPDTIAGFSSARSLTEENYLMQKMMRAVIGTNNVDHCARL
ncbi:molybdopterin oxidoreductase Fe4S4 region [Alkaliphilus metalliredigens QYMF]|uniref:Molybdopterin oxidoreductase Fe4S4 region n=3 Tax=Alkaliphilus TaxID=114627 RepID=A6TVG2_ALKMQ|nr:molybdopterin oxidoreductase Fe4S4 region [Alkaliphilus metalliredigens QYMF]